jgi:hypothetical protein
MTIITTYINPNFSLTGFSSTAVRGNIEGPQIDIVFSNFNVTRNNEDDDLEEGEMREDEHYRDNNNEIENDYDEYDDIDVETDDDDGDEYDDDYNFDNEFINRASEEIGYNITQSHIVDNIVSDLLDIGWNYRNILIFLDSFYELQERTLSNREQYTECPNQQMERIEQYIEIYERLENL